MVREGCWRSGRRVSWCVLSGTCGLVETWKLFMLWKSGISSTGANNTFTQNKAIKPVQFRWSHFQAIGKGGKSSFYNELCELNHRNVISEVEIYTLWLNYCAIISGTFKTLKLWLEKKETVKLRVILPQSTTVKVSLIRENKCGNRTKWALIPNDRVSSEFSPRTTQGGCCLPRWKPGFVPRGCPCQAALQIAESALSAPTLGRRLVQGRSSEIKGLDGTSHTYLLTFPHSSSSHGAPCTTFSYPLGNANYLQIIRTMRKHLGKSRHIVGSNLRIH